MGLLLLREYLMAANTVSICGVVTHAKEVKALPAGWRGCLQLTGASLDAVLSRSPR